MVLFIRDQMTRTIEYVQAQNAVTTEDIREQIKNFRNNRLLEEDQEQTNVMILYEFIYIRIYIIRIYVTLHTYFTNLFCIGSGSTEQTAANKS